MSRFRLGLLVGIVLGSVTAVGGAWLASASYVPIASRPLAADSASVIVPGSSPTIALVASAGGPAAVTSVSVTGTISSGTTNATGTITFRLWSDLLCSQQFGTSSVITVSGANSVAYLSGSLNPMTATTYRWTASYSGDSNNSPATTACGSPNSTVTITVGTATHLAVTTQPNGGTGSQVWSAQPQIAVKDAGENTVTTSTASIAIVIGSNPSGGSLTCTATTLSAIAGVAQFAGCRIDTAGNGYTLSASSSGLTSVLTLPFNITVGAATKLSFTTQPGGGDGNAAWVTQPAITVLDAGGNVVTSSTAAITLAIGTNPAVGVLSCTTNPVTVALGAATFSGCSISKAGTGYTLVASSPGLTGATSSAFNITVAKLAYSAVGTAATATSNSTVTVSYPSGTVTNDLLFLVEVNSSTGNTATPTGWTLLADQSVSGGTAFRFKVWTRLSAGESTVALAFKAGSSGSSAWVVRYRRGSGYPPNPANAAAAVRQGNSVAGATLTPSPDLTTNQTNATVITIAGIRAANTLTLGTAQSFTRRFSITNVPVGGQGVALAFSDATTTLNPTTLTSPTWSQSGTAARWAWATVAYN